MHISKRKKISNLIQTFLITHGLIVSSLVVNASAINFDSFDKEFTRIQSKIKDDFSERDPIYIFIQREQDFKSSNSSINLTDNLIQLLKLDNLYEENDSLLEVVNKTQKKWLACVQGKNVRATNSEKSNIERSDLWDNEEQIGKREKIKRIACSMGLFDERNPILIEYKYGAWLGAFLQGVRNNLHNLVIAWNKGHRFEKLVVFTGERYLRKEEGQEDDLRKLCDPKQSPLPFKEGWIFPKNARYETEYDMMKIVFDQIQLPKDMAEALINNVEFVNASKGQNSRPGTKDCYATWIKSHPEAGTIIAASSPLLWALQQIEGEIVLGNTYPLDTISPALSSDEYERKKSRIVSLIHDTVTKCLYEINHNLNN